MDRFRGGGERRRKYTQGARIPSSLSVVLLHSIIGRAKFAFAALLIVLQVPQKPFLRLRASIFEGLATVGRYTIAKGSGGGGYRVVLPNYKSVIEDDVRLFTKLPPTALWKEGSDSLHI